MPRKQEGQDGERAGAGPPGPRALIGCLPPPVAAAIGGGPGPARQVKRADHVGAAGARRERRRRRSSGGHEALRGEAAAPPARPGPGPGAVPGPVPGSPSRSGPVDLALLPAGRRDASTHAPVARAAPTAPACGGGEAMRMRAAAPDRRSQRGVGGAGVPPAVEEAAHAREAGQRAAHAQWRQKGVRACAMRGARAGPGRGLLPPTHTPGPFPSGAARPGPVQWSPGRVSGARAGSTGPGLVPQGPAVHPGPIPPGLVQACHGRASPRWRHTLTHPLPLSQQPGGSDGSGDGTHDGDGCGGHPRPHPAWETSEASPPGGAQGPLRDGTWGASPLPPPGPGVKTLAAHTGRAKPSSAPPGWGTAA